MTAAFYEQDSLYQQCCIHFDCSPRAVSMFQPPDKTRAKRRDQVSRTLGKFRKVMSGPNPPRTKQESVEAIAPIAALLLSLFWKQFAVMVVEWLWDQTQQESQS